MRLSSILFSVCALAVAAPAQGRPSQVAPFVTVDAQTIVLNDVRIIDGTGAPAREHQRITISGGKILEIAPASAGDATRQPGSAKVLELGGYTVIPGLVGMHDHMFYPVGGQPPLYSNMGFSFPRLYLAAGVTSLRTTGSVMPYEDLELKRLIDAGAIPGPRMHITAPYFEGPGSFTPVMHTLTDANDATRTAEFWIAEGATSFKAYMNITRAELAAAVAVAHAHNLKITGHLCSIGFREAAELGIDDLEHGLIVDTEFVPGKQPDICPAGGTAATLLKMDVNGPEIQQTIRTLVEKHVAVTSTLPVFEASVPNASAGAPRRPLESSRVLAAMTPQAQAAYLGARARIPPDSPSGEMLKKEMQFEFAFAKAGGLLLAGPDPTGNGGVLAGYGDQREVELLVEAGFTPLEAIRIATLNGAQYLGEQDRIGSIAASKQADLVVIKGDPSRDISDIEKVEIVFKNGIGYDSQKLIQSVQGLVGIR
ncbi:MAG TPA: amidohydrolase family protein [Terriglobales bacterium]|nr:amidohydrolase family protein [Terriglobales bacterium]